MDAAIVVEFFSAGPSDFSDMAYITFSFRSHPSLSLMQWGTGSFFPSAVSR